MTDTKGDDQLIQRAYGDDGRSNVQRYQDLIIGNRSLLFLIKFEIIQLLFCRVPGALGIALRKIFYPMILGKCGRGVLFGVDVWVRHPEKITIGDGAIIDDGALLDAKGTSNNGIVIGNHCYIGRQTVLSCKDGDITLGDYANLSTFCNISSNASIVIGEKTLIGPHTTVFATSHIFDDPDKNILDQGASAVGVTIGNDCWLGSHVTVTDGVIIGDRTVVGANGAVVRSLPEGVVAVGVPAKVIKQRG